MIPQGGVVHGLTVGHVHGTFRAQEIWNEEDRFP